MAPIRSRRTRPTRRRPSASPGCQKGCGFLAPKLLGLFDAFSGLLVQVLGLPLFTHEQSRVWLLHPLLDVGDLLVGDRGFCSLVHLAVLCLRTVQGLFRMHQRQHVDFRPHRKHQSRHRRGKGRGSQKSKSRRLPRGQFVKRLGKHDQTVERFKPRGKPKWMSKKQYSILPDSLLVRELRFTLCGKGRPTRCITISTTLLGPALYPKEKIAELYGVRWGVETHFAELKTALKMRKLKSKTAQGVLKELAVYAQVYNLVHLVMLEGARQQWVTPDRISFIATVAG